jgi:hypothetical protein
MNSSRAITWAATSAAASRSSPTLAQKFRTREDALVRLMIVRDHNHAEVVQVREDRACVESAAIDRVYVQEIRRARGLTSLHQKGDVFRRSDTARRQPGVCYYLVTIGTRELAAIVFALDVFLPESAMARSSLMVTTRWLAS